MDNLEHFDFMIATYKIILYVFNQYSYSNLRAKEISTECAVSNKYLENDKF